MPNQDEEDQSASTTGPVKGDFIAPSEVADVDERADALPQQEEFWRPPTRFGSVPVEKEPLGWNRRKGFRKLYPAVYLPFQVVERVAFGHPDLEPNRLFWGDNLHVMRQLPSESTDLIYLDPPFFSGRQYNVIFGDQNELRSFSDIWEGGMPGYLIWLNARLYEMKRLLKKTGSIYVHLDWHASHYVKVEMDKIFGVSNLRNEIVWYYRRYTASSRMFQKLHDCILWYSKGSEWSFRDQYEPYSETAGKADSHYKQDETGKWFRWQKRKGQEPYKVFLKEDGKKVGDVWPLQHINASAAERIGYPTQKPEALLERIIQASSNEGDVVADFFTGGGTTAAVAQRLGRRWIACDQSRVAVAITADRLTRQVEEQTGKLFPVPDFTVEHWGVYETRRLADMPSQQFRAFVLKCFGAVDEEHQAGIHGMKGAVPVWVGEPNPKKGVTAQDVQDFANAIRKTLRYKQDNLRDGIMLAWAFRQDAMDAAERLRRLEQTDLNFIRLDQVRIDSLRFREHVSALSTDHADYENFLTFVQPPRVEVGHKRIAARTYRFDVSETVVMNAGAKIINVQWDFDYGKRFSSTPGYSFVRGAKKEPQLQAQYEFPTAGRKRIACKVQDDMGGEGLGTAEIEVS
ncbi:site-specific DNA-methyltransferase [Tabrizicola sp.]|uniref:DNA-methyltransferase n=1 Tax=Tabrizicola sp. TaxID=2005166 RepID=UPI0027339C99|nr:site-specific DNA-methyltransferase [Tabrizicola sp.]MDP3196667.1 site-specific DNA-methyltransferase [Tabrizicola sp.]